MTCLVFHDPEGASALDTVHQVEFKSILHRASHVMQIIVVANKIQVARQFEIVEIKKLQHEIVRDEAIRADVRTQYFDLAALVLYPAIRRETSVIEQQARIMWSSGRDWR